MYQYQALTLFAPILSVIVAAEIYITSADKLAALINADYLHNQFPCRDWKKEYHDIFQKVKNIIKVKMQLFREKSIW